jgi:hypothetical protein
MKNRYVKYAAIGILLGILLYCVTGCVSPSKFTNLALLPEERIFTAPKGQVMNLMLDGKPIDITFPNDMKVVDPSILVRQEQQLNDATLKSIKAEKKNSGIMSLLTVIFSAIGGIFTIWVKNKVTKPKTT